MIVASGVDEKTSEKILSWDLQNRILFLNRGHLGRVLAPKIKWNEVLIKLHDCQQNIPVRLHKKNWIFLRYFKISNAIFGYLKKDRHSSLIEEA